MSIKINKAIDKGVTGLKKIRDNIKRMSNERGYVVKRVNKEREINCL